MAAFCAPCTPELFGADVPRQLNDLVGWLDEQGLTARSWTLCEGCGLHLFDNAGERCCTAAPAADAAPELDPCRDCLHIDLAPAGAA